MPELTLTRVVTQLPFDLFLFEIDSMRLDTTVDTILIPHESPNALDEERMIRQVLESAKAHAPKPYDPGWYGISWHRYVLEKFGQPASHPDAQGYVVWFEVMEDGKWRVRTDSPLLSSCVV
jgi:hypothetical protein